jgi:hypothetical protein
MSPKVIQLARLEEFVQEELHEGNLVRVVVLDVTPPRSRPCASWACTRESLTTTGTFWPAISLWPASSYSTAVAQAIRPGRPTTRPGRKRKRSENASLSTSMMSPPRKGSPFVVSGWVIDMGETRPLRANWNSDPALNRLHQRLTDGVDRTGAGARLAVRPMGSSCQSPPAL